MVRPSGRTPGSKTCESGAAARHLDSMGGEDCGQLFRGFVEHAGHDMLIAAGPFEGEAGAEFYAGTARGGRGGRCWARRGGAGGRGGGGCAGRGVSKWNGEAGQTA